MAQFIIKIPDQVIKEDADLLTYFKALQLMANRMAFSHFKYGAMSDSYPDNSKAIACAQEREKMYDASGNIENCLDAANFLIIEYLFPSHVKAHFREQTSSESPGRVWREE